MEFTVQADTRRLEFQLARLAQAAGVELGPIIKQEAAYFLKSFIKTTPPPSLSAGKNAIDNDLRRVSTPLYYEQFEAHASKGGFYKSIARYIRKRDAEKLRMLLQNPNLNLFRGMQLLGNVDELNAEHQRRRVGQSRRRPRGSPQALSFSGDYKRHRNSVHRRVGFIVSGWNDAARAVGVPIKKFSARTYERSSQSVSYSFGKNPFIVATNGNMPGPMFQKMLGQSLKYRERITIRKIEAAIAGRAVNLGFTRIGSPTAIPAAA